MSKGTLYTSKAQANKSTGARLAWRYFEKMYYKNLISIQFDFNSQEWIASYCGIWGEVEKAYINKTEMEKDK